MTTVTSGVFTIHDLKEPLIMQLIQPTLLCVVS